jgi:CHAT domain-containing protein/tetratricopeptide (TPR) repeat protein
LCLAAGAAGQPIADPTAAASPERRQLLEQAENLSREAGRLHQQGRGSAAVAAARQALQAYQRLYPTAEYPRGHTDLLTALRRLAGLLQQYGQYALARPYAEQGLNMARQLYPRDRYPRGHPFLADHLNHLGLVLSGLGEYDRVHPYYEEALRMRQALYPADRYPRGHVLLADSLGNLGMLFAHMGEHARALPYVDEALNMNRRLFPPEKYPQGRLEVAFSLNDLGSVLLDLGEYARALAVAEEAVQMCRRLSPDAKKAPTDPLLAACLNNMGILLDYQGEHARALPYFEKALRLHRRLYPEADFPQGHPLLAQGLANVGSVLQDQGDFARALPYLEQAVAMKRRLYPRTTHPQGHADLAGTLRRLGAALVHHGEPARALPYCREALDMLRRLYPPDRYPNGHPDLAGAVTILGELHQEQGDYEQALTCFRKALAMRRLLYPEAQYPQGTRELAHNLDVLGFLFLERRQPAQALPYFEQSLAMYQKQADLFLAAASETEALNFVAKLYANKSALLSSSRQPGPAEDAGYTLLWRAKAVVFRACQRRQQDLARAGDAETRRLLADLLAVRRQLARLLLAPPGKRTQRDARLKELCDAKLRLERRLAERLPAFRLRQAGDQLGPDELVRQLLADTVLIDLWQYVRFSHETAPPGRAGWRGGLYYVAFVLARDRPIRRVELGESAPLDRAVTAWRADLAAGKAASPAAQELRKLLWAPLAAHLPATSRTVLVAPDGALCRLPWAALPVRPDGRPLLEEHAVALVPDGPSLLERLLAAKEAGEKGPAGGLLVAVGDVSYDGPPAPAAAGVVVTRSAEGARKRPLWPALPGTVRELEQIQALAGSRIVHLRRGAEASTARLLADLGEGKRPPRWLHLATHGFFADPDPKRPSILELDRKLFVTGPLGERVGAGARNPLVLSGLVLAGANLPPPQDLDGLLHSDRGILTAEAIAGLSLEGLELAVLSACETGLGEVAGGEGVFGLQRAFHLAGARNVIASLWQVDDEATAALMSLFYHHLWVEQRPPLEALRQAQLTLYHHPERMAVLARKRGPDFEKAARLPATPPASGAAPARRSPPRLWAGFILSGPGR